MMIPEYLAKLKEGVSAWNKWRTENQDNAAFSDSYLMRDSSLQLLMINLSKVKLEGADLSGANLTDVLLSRADLKGADLTGADLTGADLTGANLTGANLTGANLTGANLTRADLSGADLSKAILRNTNLWGVDLDQVKLEGVDLTELIGEAPILDHSVIWTQGSYLLQTVLNEVSPLQLVIDPGSASAEEIGELLFEISKLYQMLGGSGIDFKPTEIDVQRGEVHCE